MKVLLAIDGSQHSDSAVLEVSRRPWPEGTEVRIIAVESPWTEDLSRGRSSNMFDELNKQLRAETWQRLNDAACMVKRNATGLIVPPVLREGHPKDRILDEAEQWNADLIVVGSHGYGAVRRLFLGSVSLAVATNARCSVEIIRSPPDSVPTPIRVSAANKQLPTKLVE